eukprot:5487613-Lingulodinium_polyedra.AAC.1
MGGLLGRPSALPCPHAVAASEDAQDRQENGQEIHGARREACRRAGPASGRHPGSGVRAPGPD